MHAAHVLSAHAHNIVTIMQVKVVIWFTCAAAAANRCRMQMQCTGYVLYRAVVMGKVNVVITHALTTSIILFGLSRVFIAS